MFMFSWQEVMYYVMYYHNVSYLNNVAQLDLVWIFKHYGPAGKHESVGFRRQYTFPW